jgi:hypothetical protein
MRIFYTVLLLMFVASLGTRSASGFVEFHKEWVKMYIDDEDDSEANQDYIKLVAKGKHRCLVCHQGKKKDNHNPYGIHFVGELGKDDKKDTDKIVEWLTKVGEMPVDPDAEDSLTYNDLIQRKEFPGGKLEDLEAEPKEEGETGDGQ